MIKKCNLTLKSIVDGNENLFSVEGRLETFGDKIKLCYREDPAIIHLVFHDEKAWIDRDGDYGLRIALVEGEQTVGEIAIGDNVGELEIRTHKILFDYFGDGLKARLRYDILLGDGVQEMDLYVEAKVTQD